MKVVRWSVWVCCRRFFHIRCISLHLLFGIYLLMVLKVIIGPFNFRVRE